MEKIIMFINTKEQKADGKNAYVKVGEVAVFYPSLEEMGIAIPASGKDEDGFLTYTDPKVQYVYDGIVAAVKASTRNKLVSGTATLKDGCVIAETVEQLLESGGNGNKGDALAAVREMLAAFKAYLLTTGKSAGVQQAIYDLAANKKSLMVVTQDKKDKFAGTYLSGFAETLTEEQAARFERPLLALQEACTASDALDDM